MDIVSELKYLHKNLVGVASKNALLENFFGSSGLNLLKLDKWWIGMELQLFLIQMSFVVHGRFFLWTQSYSATWKYFITLRNE